MTALEYGLSLLREGTLQFDSQGRLFRLKSRGYPVAPRRAESPSGKGYLRLVLGVPGEYRTFSVQAHILLWVWLHGPIPEGLQVNHKDLNKSNNHPDNLELTTPSGNIRHSYANGRALPWSKSSANTWRGKPRVSTDTVDVMERLRREGKLYREISDATGVSITHVQRLLAKKVGS